MHPCKHSLIILVFVSLTACSSTSDATRAVPTMADPTDAAPTVALPVATAPVPTMAVVIPTDIPPTAEPLVTTVPVGPRLRDVWPQAASSIAPTNYLIYSDVAEAQDGTGQETYAFWQLDLRDPTKRQKIVDIPVPGNAYGFPILGALSPDGTAIAYLVPTGDSDADLHVIQRDGTHDHVIAQKIAAAVSRGRPRFVWSPDSTQLAFIKYAEQGQDFYVYDRHADTSRRIAQVGGAGLTGWADNHRVLIHMVTDQDKPQQITSIDSTTDAQESLGTFPEKGAIASIPSPDNSAVLVSGYVFDVATRHFTKLDQLNASALWSSDSRALLAIPQHAEHPAQFITLARPTEAISLTVLPTHTASSTFAIDNSSPDGRYILVCEGRDNIPGVGGNNSWVYDIAQDKWQILKANGQCLSAVGWTPTQ